MSGVPNTTSKSEATATGFDKETTDTIAFQKWLDGRDIVNSIQGYLRQNNGKDVRGQLIIDYFNSASTLSTRNTDFAKNLLSMINQTQHRLPPGQTRLVIPVHVGNNHFLTVAIDTKENKAVIVEPMHSSSYDADIATLETILKQAFPGSSSLALPEIKIERCATKIQDDGWSCGHIASKMSEHLLTCKHDLSTAITHKHLPKELHNLKTEEQQKALVADMQKAYQVQLEYSKHLKEFHIAAINATVMGLFNLVATHKLDDEKQFKETKVKLLKLFEKYKTVKNNYTKPDATEVTWDAFKKFLLNNNTEESQRQLAADFKQIWLNAFNIDFKEDPFQNYQAKMYEFIVADFKDFLEDKPRDSKSQIVERSLCIQDKFNEIKNDASLKSTEDRIAAFAKWWRESGFVQILNLNGSIFPNEYDIAASFNYFGNIDFNYGAKNSEVSNYFTPGYGIISAKNLVDVGLYSDALMKDLCDERNGILTKLPTSDQEYFHFKKMAVQERKNKLLAIIKKYPGIPATKDIEGTIADLLKFIKSTQPHPSLTLVNEANQWNIIDNDPNSNWLKIKSFKGADVAKYSPEQKTAKKSQEQEPASDKKTVNNEASKVTSSKIDCKNEKSIEAIKKVCQKFQSDNAGKKYEVKDNKVNVNGIEVEIIENGFQHNKISEDVIEFDVQAMAAVFDAQNMPAGQRYVKLTLAPENEKFRVKYRELLGKCVPPLILEEDVKNRMEAVPAKSSHSHMREKLGGDKKVPPTTSEIDDEDLEEDATHKATPLSKPASAIAQKDVTDPSKGVPSVVPKVNPTNCAQEANKEIPSFSPTPMGKV